MAIAFDAATLISTGSSSTSVTGSVTVASSNPMLFVGVAINGSGNISSVTYNGQNMTMILAEKQSGTGGVGQFYSLWYIYGQSGTHNVVVNNVGSAVVAAAAVSYTGVAQQAPEASAQKQADNATSITQAVTTLTDNAWLVGIDSGHSAGPLTAGSNTHNTITSTGQFALIDSNAAQTPTGSHSLTGTGSSQSMMITVCSIAPYAAAPAVNGNFLAFM